MSTETLPALEARVRPHIDDSGRNMRLLAFAELTIGGAFVIKNIRVYRMIDEPSEDPFIVFPAERAHPDAADRWYDVAHPCTIQARMAATKIILDAYKAAMEARA